jgi:Arc/MetJ-type ribon-helix-helix transcriptional regulator
MTIQITEPELEALIQQRLQSGAFQNVEDVLLQALRSTEPKAKAAAAGHRSGDKDGVELFADSPFAALDVDFLRR